MMHWLQALRYYAEDQLLSELKQKHPAIAYNADYITFEDGVIVKLSYDIGVIITRECGWNNSTLWVCGFVRPASYTQDQMLELIRTLAKARKVMAALEDANL